MATTAETSRSRQNPKAGGAARLMPVFGQIFAHTHRGITDCPHGFRQLLLGDPQRLGPIPDLMLLCQRDAAGILVPRSLRFSAMCSSWELPVITS
jgi:hypothetical protein